MEQEYATMIVVTAPTGRIGSQILANLLQQDKPVRVVVRDPNRLPAQVCDRVEVVVGSHRHRDVVDRAFDGADSVFWLVPADPKAQSVYDAYVGFSIPATDAIVRHGVDRVVTVSALGRGQQRYAGHVSASLAMEDLLRSAGVHLRALTMPSFMDNLLWQLHSIKNNGVISATIPGDHKAPWVATRDIAAVAARLLLDHTWTGQDSLGVLGPEDLSSVDMAAILTDVLGTPIQFEEGSREEDKQHFLGFGYSDAMAQSMIDMDIAKEHGIDNALQRTPENTTPTSFRRWAEEVLKPALDAQ
jgi:uncharacterized protein YbjT (DUF2867 family)